MRSKTVLLIALTVLLLNVLATGFRVRKVSAAGTIYIRADGSIDPPSAPILNVGNVTYTFTDNINDSIQIQRDNITLDGAGFSLQGNGTGMATGIYLSYRSNVTIKNMVIDGFNNTGIWLYQSSNNTVSGSLIANNTGDGIYLEHGFLNNVFGNTITNNEGIGVYVNYGSNTTVSENTITNNTSGVRVDHTSTDNWISGNTIANNTVDGVQIIRFSDENTVSGNNITDNRHGILVSDSNNHTISGNYIAKHNDGLFFSSSSNNTVSGNTITQAISDGIIFWMNCFDNTISGNDVVNSSGHGIRIYYSSNSLLFDNFLVGNKFGFSVGGFGLSQFLHSIDTSNLVDGKPVYYLTNQRGIIVNSSSHPQIGYLALINSTNVTVENQTLVGNGVGLQLAYTNNSRILTSYIANNGEGVRLDNSFNNTISGNNITNNKNRGVYLKSSSNNTVSGNTLTSSNQEGVYLESSSNNTVSGNIIANNSYGVYLVEAFFNTVSGNTITNSTEGLYFEDSSYNIIFGNNIRNHFNGILFESSPDNTFYHNNLVNNTRHTHFGTFPIDANFWDNGVEGNFWSNYTSVDSNYDGIGDTAHVISANNTDNYPLAGLFSDFPISYEGETYHITTICGSAISEFQLNNVTKTISFNVTGPDYTVGSCRVAIPNLIAQDLWQGNYTVLVDGEPPIMTNNWTDGTHTYVYFKYSHSEREVTIIPEFPPSLILPLFMTAALFAAIVFRREW